MRRLTLDGRTLNVLPNETLLATALRHGVELPNACRVGGCGTCKCRVVSGEVKALTHTEYLLGDDEISRGVVLACQSVPLTDVSLERVRAAENGAPGRIVERTRVTPDIVRLTVEMDRPIDFRAGQFANLVLEGLDDVARSYSFASPPRDDGRVSFFVRKVPGGRLSTLLNDDDVVGRRVRLDGPRGDFWLRAGDAPLVMVAGGSGLAPILAMLQEAVGVKRPVTLLFGVRDEADLYATEEIAALERAWQAPFRFVPVLSQAAEGSTWTGARGLVTEHLAAQVTSGSHAYLCGAPAMVDAAVGALLTAGVPRHDIRFDRFTTRGDAPLLETKGETAGVRDYLKFSLFHIIGLLAVAALLRGGAATTGGLLTILTLYMLGDAVSGDDTTTPHYTRPWLLTAQLWMALPLLALIVFSAVWTVSSGDPLGFGALVQSLTGRDLFAAREATTFGHHVSAWVMTSLMIGLVGTIPAHELTHRTWDRVSMFVGRWLLAFSFDTSFSIEHVYGHHRYVATLEDPATAPRGRSVYAHIVSSTWRGNVSAWRIEAARLRRVGRAVWSWQNLFLRGHLMSVGLIVIAAAMGGVRGALFFTACALWGKALLEIVNYMEHYGLVREPSQPVQPRHSWNTNRRVSSWSMFNLTRHSHHHAQGEVPYHQLAPYPDAPVMVNGYLTTIVLTLIPPLWHALMTPKVLAWDREQASPAERRLAKRASEAVGWNLTPASARPSPRKRGEGLS